ncbi:MAG: RimK family alpha-L-glutamate ligase [Clostridia bacterium]|nr:RimK family alpha-L-glutamate ligase [Clostridia bacterium]
MKCAIIVNAYSAMQSAMNQPLRLAAELKKLGVQAQIIKNDRFLCCVDGGRLINRLEGYDFCIYLDKDKYVSAMLEKSGLRLFNSHEAIRICDDKFDTFIRLSENGINMPLTLPGLLCYSSDEKIKEDTVDIIERETGYPVVVKHCYGSLGEGVFLCRNRGELTKKMQEVKMLPHLFQKFISSSSGTDIRVIVIGGRVVAAMKRESKTDFRSNIELGGKGESFVLPDDFRLISENAARIIGLDYCGIDLLIGQNGEPVLCEVNSNAFFGGIEKVTGINVAAQYAEYISGCFV